MPNQPEPPPRAADDPGTESRLAVLEQIAAETRSGFAELRTEIRIAEARGEMRAGMAELRAEIRAGIADLRADMRAGIADLRDEMREMRTDVTAEIRGMRGELHRLLLMLMLAFLAATLLLIAHGLHWIP